MPCVPRQSLGAVKAHTTTLGEQVVHVSVISRGRPLLYMGAIRRVSGSYLELFRALKNERSFRAIYEISTGEHYLCAVQVPTGVHI